MNRNKGLQRVHRSLSVAFTIAVNAVLVFSETAVDTMIFRAMADVGCRMILESLARGEAAVQDFTARFEILHPTVSRLATALVSGEHNGRHLYYHVVPRGVHRFMDWIMPHRTFWSERVNHLEQLLRTVDQ